MHQILKFPVDPNVKAEAQRLFEANHREGQHPSFAATHALRHLSTLLGGYGVESLPERGVLYVNMGETYQPTVLFDCQTRTFVWGKSWGDLVEEQERGHPKN